jgi:hypothetical protein
VVPEVAPSELGIERAEVIHQVRAIHRQFQDYRRGPDEFGEEHYGSCQPQAGSQ